MVRVNNRNKIKLRVNNIIMVTKEVVYKIITEVINNKSLLKCLKYETYTYTNSKGEQIEIQIAEVHKKPTFRDRLLEAYNYQMVDGWRVDAYEDDNNPLPVENWENCRMFVTKSGSTIAIREDGDIISVCKNLSNIPSDNMKAVMQFAVEHGGTKLDSFDGNWGFYRACGFEPVSWIQFNPDYSPRGPNGWINGTNHQEPIVFMKYTGNSKSLSSTDALEEQRNFYQNVVANTGEDAYDDAYALRDESM